MMGGGVLLTGLFDRQTTAYALNFVFWFFFWLSAFVLIPSFVGGLGLLLERTWGRVVLIIVSVELLLLIPVGTAVGIYGLWALLRAAPQEAAQAVWPSMSAATAAAGVCAHLGPLEGAMRARGIALDVRGGRPSARCRVHVASLARQFSPLEPVQYMEFFQPERAAEDNPTARLYCRACSSWIDTLHPLECNLETAWFPAGPAPLMVRAERAVSPGGAVTSLACSRSGVTAVAAGPYQDAAELSIWEADGGLRLRRIAVRGTLGSLAWSADERLVVCGRVTPGQGGKVDECVLVLEAGSGQEVLRFGGGLYGVRSLAVSSDGRLVVTSSMMGPTHLDGSAVDLWELSSGRHVARLAQIAGTPTGENPYFTDVALTEDGALTVAGCEWPSFGRGVASGSGQERPWWWWRGVRIWQLGDGREVDLIRHSARVSTLAITRDSRRLMVGGDRFGVWNLTDGSRLWDRPGWGGQVAAVSPDGRWVARGTGWRADNHGPYVESSVELYDGASGEFLTLGRQQTPPTALGFAEGGGTLVTGGHAGEVRWWE